MLLWTYLYFSSNRILQNLAQESFKSLISSASYNSIFEILDEGYDYKSLVSVSFDKDNNINMIMTDSLQINNIASKLASNTYDYLEKHTKYGVDVPLGAFTGIKLVSGFGKAIKMKLLLSNRI